MVEEMAKFLRECFENGSFTIIEAKNIVNSPKFALLARLEIHEGAKNLFDEFISNYDLEKVDVTEQACRIFLKGIELNERKPAISDLNLRVK